MAGNGRVPWRKPDLRRCLGVADGRLAAPLRRRWPDPGCEWCRGCSLGVMGKGARRAE